MHSRICEDCWQSFRTEYKNVTLCWDCQRVRMIKDHPEIAWHNDKLLRLAFENGLVIERTPDGVTVRDIFDYEDDDQLWREDLNKIVARHKRKYGKRLTMERAWNLTAIAARKRAAAKYPTDRLKLIAQKRTETTEDGEVITNRDTTTQPDCADETDGGACGRAHLV